MLSCTYHHFRYFLYDLRNTNFIEIAGIRFEVWHATQCQNIIIRRLAIKYLLRIFPFRTLYAA